MDITYDFKGQIEEIKYISEESVVLLERIESHLQNAQRWYRVHAEKKGSFSAFLKKTELKRAGALADKIQLLGDEINILLDVIEILIPNLTSEIELHTELSTFYLGDLTSDINNDAHIQYALRMATAVKKELEGVITHINNRQYKEVLGII